MNGYSKFVLNRDGLESLLSKLRAANYHVIGPRVHDDAIMYDTVESLSDFPIGYSDVQAPGRYRLAKSQNSQSVFRYTVGQNSVKQFLYPARKEALTIARGKRGFEIEQRNEDKTKYAFVGLRACELASLEVRDKVLTHGSYVDRDYLEHRRRMFVVAVNCTVPGGTCFCASMKTGPAATNGFDIALTEIEGSAESKFVVSVGSDRGY